MLRSREIGHFDLGPRARVDDFETPVAAVVDRVEEVASRLVEIEIFDVVFGIAERRRELAVLELVDGAKLAELRGPHDDLTRRGAVTRRVFFALPLAEERRQLLRRGIEFVIFVLKLADRFGEEQTAVFLVIFDVPEPVVAEDELLGAAGDVVAVDRVGVGFAIVGAEEDRLRIASRELVSGLNARLVLDGAQRAAIRIEQIEPGILFTLAIAKDDEPFAVGGDVDEPRHVLPAGELHRKTARPVELPDLGNARHRPIEEHRLAVR